MYECLDYFVCNRVSAVDDNSKGYFIHPTVIETKDPNFKTMKEEIFGPVLTVFVYPDAEFEKTVQHYLTSSPHVL